MIRLAFFALLGVSSLAATDPADEVCPWLNSATAGGVLGGSVSSNVTRSSRGDDDATCEYTHRNGHLTYVMHIEVITMKDVHGDMQSNFTPCGGNLTRLRSIGNEAVACSVNGKGGEAEQVISRVRDRAFVVRVSTNDSSIKPSVIREQARNVAEQVAGNLF